MQILDPDKEPTNFMKVLWQILQICGWWNVCKIQQLSVPAEYQRATAGIDVQTTRRFGNTDTTIFLSN